MGSGVGGALGISEESCAGLIAAHWERWEALVPALGCVTDPQGLESWLRSEARPEADEVLRGLAELAAESGNDDTDAALVLAWVLHPGADALASRLFDMGHDVYQHVAAFLWIEIRTFPWRTKARVAANILLRVRQKVLIEFDEPGQVDNHDRALALTDPISPDVLQHFSPDVMDILENTPSDRLEEVLAWGCEHGVITNVDRLMLLDLVKAASVHPVRQRASTALLSKAGTEMVGQSWGISGRSVRRFAKASIDALAAAVGQVA
jgi:hypothetical protein